MEFDYNSTRKKLILAEYGRNVQNMVAYICTLPTKEERNRHAQVVIDLMGFLNPHLRDVSDFKHKLWDHLHIISDFQIDVDSPYPKPTPGAIHAKPETLNYPQHRIKYKHYGYIIELMIEKAKKIGDADRKKNMVQSMANFMKMAYVTWNKDSVSDDHIVEDLKELSNGELVLDEDVNLTKLEFKTPPPGNRTKSGATNNQQNNGGQKNRQQQHNKNQNNGAKKRKRF
ncbi:DUF4290 domain-containing protein [Olivibacter sp. XZL3]|uniref:DUF4290 domain-containing protein n=1 Tax=Olivibacter sp. XZL3 TaxID=1735116 RepID=UPI001066C103|nr:DUF4290 domain-containing protein [Olivibacter sp. XZL3]